MYIFIHRVRVRGRGALPRPIEEKRQKSAILQAVGGIGDDRHLEPGYEPVYSIPGEKFPIEKGFFSSLVPD